MLNVTSDFKIESSVLLNIINSVTRFKVLENNSIISEFKSGL